MTLSSQSNAEHPLWSSPMCVNVKEWRDAGATANGNTALAANGIYAAGTVINANTGAGALASLPVMIAKGPDGRLSVRAPGGARFAHRIKVWLN